MKDTFCNMHPFVNLIFFVFVIGFSMFLLNPVCLGISFLCSAIYCIYLKGRKALRLCFVYILPMILFVVIINPVFNHAGVTILMYLPTGNPLTLESIIYGLSSALLLATVMLWFSCFNKVMTSDKFVYLFGRIIPSLSLMLSMILRFIPKFSARFREVKNAQKCIGRDMSEGAITRRIKNAIKIVSIMISWSMENAVDTADSMKSRGYGLKGRTAFSIFKFEKRDALFLTAILTFGIFLVFGIYFGGFKFRYFPSIKGELFAPLSLLMYIAYGFLMLMPMILNVKEDRKWKRLRSKI